VLKGIRVKGAGVELLPCEVHELRKKKKKQRRRLKPES
jgi:hypothetical protein